MRCSIVTPYARTYNPHSTILYLGLYFRLNCHNIYYQSLITNDPNAINRDNHSHSGTKKICVKVPANPRLCAQKTAFDRILWGGSSAG